jgi:hypothetical protein
VRGARGVGPAPELALEHEDEGARVQPEGAEPALVLEAAAHREAEEVRIEGARPLEVGHAQREVVDHYFT